jgi:hypothetical protein
MTYFWTKYDDRTNGIALPWPEGITRTESTLVFPAILYGIDEGFYGCVVTNAAGGVNTTRAALEINEGKPTWRTYESLRLEINPTVLVQAEEFIMLKWLKPSLNNKSTTITQYEVAYSSSANTTWQIDKVNTIDGPAELELLHSKDLGMDNNSTATFSFKVRATTESGIKSNFSGSRCSLYAI